jgi:hypothetical protein
MLRIRVLGIALASARPARAADPVMVLAGAEL